MKGYRTIILNALLVAGGPVLEYLGTVNWTDMLGPTGSVLALAVINIGMRFITTTPVGGK